MHICKWQWFQDIVTSKIFGFSDSIKANNEHILRKLAVDAMQQSVKYYKHFVSCYLRKSYRIMQSAQHIKCFIYSSLLLICCSMC